MNDTRSKVLIVTVGLPYSGKSTWAKGQMSPVVCPDSIRLAIHGERFIALAEPFVWAIAKVMVRSLFLAGHNAVILDACNTSRHRRDDWQSKEWKTLFKIIKTPIDICKKRAISKGDDEILPVIERMAIRYEPLDEDERQWLEPSTVLESKITEVAL